MAAKKTKFEIPKELKEKIEKTIDDAMEEMAYEIVAEIDEGYQDTISAFYDHYPSPKYYKRTESLRMASSGARYFKTVKSKDSFGNITQSMKVKDRNVHKYKNGGYRLGIRVSSNNIPGDPYKKTKMIKQEDGSWTPIKKYGADKEWVFARSFERGIHGFDEIDAKLWSVRALKESEKYKWKIPPHKAPPKMSPSPKEKMDTWFEKYKKNSKHFDEICHRCMNDSLKRNFKKMR